MVLVLVAGGVFAWLTDRAHVQHDAVQAIEKAGGEVAYDYQTRKRPPYRADAPSGPKWLVRLLGVDYFADVTRVVFNSPQPEEILAQVGRLRHLKRLDADEIRITDAGLAHLSGLKELRTLICTGSPGLTDAGLAHLSGMVQLKNLWLTGDSCIEGPGLAHLAGFDQLESVVLDTSTHTDLGSLTGHSRLRHLRFNPRHLTDENFAQISQLTGLEILEIYGETGSDAGVAQLRTLPNLKQLSVAGAWFTDAGLDHVAEMDRLSIISVSTSTSVTPAGLYDLQQRRPKLEIDIPESGSVTPSRLTDLRNAVGPNARSPEPQ